MAPIHCTISIEHVATLVLSIAYAYALLSMWFNREQEM